MHLDICGSIHVRPEEDISISLLLLTITQHMNICISRDISLKLLTNSKSLEECEN